MKRGRGEGEDETRDLPATSEEGGLASSLIRWHSMTHEELNLITSALRKLKGDANATILGVHGKVSGANVKEMLLACAKPLEESPLQDLPPDVAELPTELVASAEFRYAIAKLGVNMYKLLRKSHPQLKKLLPDYKKVWKANVAVSSDSLMPILDVHGQGIELDPRKVMNLAVETFGLWKEKLVSFCFHFDATKEGKTVFGFSLLHLQPALCFCRGGLLSI
jgi:hypothetical protein